jgi:biopolymer transport protein ExbB/TolQ
MNVFETDIPPLSWARRDPEQRLAFSGGRFTRVNTWCALLLGVLLSVGFYAALLTISETYFAETFFERGPVPYAIVFYTAWSLAILGLKWLKLLLQRRALSTDVIPQSPEFVITPATAQEVLNRVLRVVEDPRQFVLFNRITVALSNLRNLGNVGEVDEVLQAQAANDESMMETSYGLLQGFVWAVPVLGFIGTVQGLSVAIGGFGAVLAESEQLAEVKGALREVVGGLSIAFETTMQGLLAALAIQLLLTALKKAEEEFLDGCSDYCTRHIVGKLRLARTPLGTADGGAAGRGLSSGGAAT